MQQHSGDGCSSSSSSSSSSSNNSNSSSSTNSGNGGAGSKEKKKQKTAEAAAEAAPGNNAQLINDKEVVAVTVEVLVQELNDLVSRAAKQEDHARTLMRRT